MNDQDESELLLAPRHTKMPACSWQALGIIRAVIPHEYPQPYNNPFLEMLYIDGWGKPFWGPLPRFYLPPEPPDPEAKGWRRFLPEAFR